MNVIGKRLTIRGMIVSDALDQLGEFEAEVGGYLREGKLHSHETVVHEMENAVDAFLGLFRGDNIGKMVMDVR